MPTTTWDANSKSAGVTLSGGNLVATITATSSNVAANRTLTGLSYFEITATTMPNVASIGICNRSFSFSSGTLLGANNNGLGYRTGGTVVLNGATLATIAAYVAGNVIRGAVNPLLSLIWFAVGAGNWNNDVSANPATNTNGIDFSTMSLGPLRPAAGATFSTNHVLTAAFSSGGWAFSAPSGYSSVDTTQAAGESVQLPTLMSAKQAPISTPFQFVGSKPPLGYGPGGYTTVSGTVYEENSVIAAPALLFDQDTFEFLGKTISDASTGAYVIPAFGRKKVVAFFLKPPDYQAIALDGLIPI